MSSRYDPLPVTQSSVLEWHADRAAEYERMALQAESRMNGRPPASMSIRHMRHMRQAARWHRQAAAILAGKS